MGAPKNSSHTRPARIKEDVDKPHRGHRPTGRQNTCFPMAFEQSVRTLIKPYWNPIKTQLKPHSKPQKPN